MRNLTFVLIICFTSSALANELNDIKGLYQRTKAKGEASSYCLEKTNVDLAAIDHEGTQVPVIALTGRILFIAMPNTKTFSFSNSCETLHAYTQSESKKAHKTFIETHAEGCEDPQKTPRTVTERTLVWNQKAKTLRFSSVKDGRLALLCEWKKSRR